MATSDSKCKHTTMSAGQTHHHRNYRHHHLHNSFACLAGCSRRLLRIAWPLVATTSLTRAGRGISMSYRRYIALALIIWIVCLGCGPGEAATTTTTTTTPRPSHQEESERQMHPSLFVDAKVWRGNTEFGERANWLDGRKPCSLLERVAIEQNEAVVSLGDAMDSIAGGTGSGQLKSDIRQFVLPTDGLLLLEDDTLAVGQRDPAFLQMLNDTGDCFDSSTLPDDLQRTTWFRFAPHSDAQSWFNPTNWYSLMNAADQAAGDELAPLMVPESHQIPCAEDIVLFGNRQESLFSLVEANSERSRLLAFKVNFRASTGPQVAANLTRQRPAVGTNGLRVAKLKIGDKSYTQAEFDQLATIYGNNLFQLSDELSALAGNTGDGGERPQSVLTIDESSIQATPEDFAVCLEEPGCECGNEQPALMEIICSFNEPLTPHEMPCRDPIQSAGYCNKICATSVNINMDPTRFSERFVANLMNKIMTGQEEEAAAGGQSQHYFSDYIFLGSRRVDHNKYEITMRPVPDANGDYSDAIGRDLELGQLIKEQLEKAATKSFYGIKTIGIKSSVDWRQNNRKSIFTLTLILLLPLAITLFAKFDDRLFEIVAPLWQTNHRASNDRSHLSMVSDEVLVTSDDNESFSGIGPTSATVDNLAMADLDASSATGSTLNLLDVMDE